MKIAQHHPLVRRQLFQAHRPPGVELLGADRHLCAQPELAAVVEAGAGVEQALHVRNVYEFFWDSLKGEMKKLDYIAFHIPKLGELNLTKSKIDKLEKYLEKYDENYVEKIEKVKRLIQERYDKKNEKRELRKKFLEEMEKNNGGGVV